MFIVYVCSSTSARARGNQAVPALIEQAKAALADAGGGAVVGGARGNAGVTPETRRWRLREAALLS